MKTVTSQLSGGGNNCTGSCDYIFNGKMITPFWLL